MMTREPSQKIRPSLFVVSLGLVMLVASPVGAEMWTQAGPAQTGIDAPDAPYAELVEAVGPSVVSVLVSYGDDDLPPQARRSFPGPIPDHAAEGTGFVINSEGYVVTNFHVIDDATRITIRLTDDTELDAQVVGGDPMTDIALLKVEADDPLPAAPLGDSSDLQVGEFVVAIGNPLGLSHSVTAGIISALDRRDLPIEGRDHQGNFIQIDAAINPGNSGGPLINMNGEVVGMNTAVNRQGQGISFAIPIDLIKTLLPRLEDHGWVDRSWLGVRIQPLDPMLARSFGLGDDGGGALVTEVLDDSPADQAGLEQRDIILSLEGTDIEESDELPLRVSTMARDDDATLEVFRDGEIQSLQVELESLPDQQRPELPELQATTETNDRPAGLEVEEMTESFSRQLDAPEDTGLVVTSLHDNSPAARAGVQDRDVIVAVDSVQVDSADQLEQALDDAADGSVVRLELLRDGRTIYKAFELNGAGAPD